MSDRRRPAERDDLLAGSVEALAVLLDAGIAPTSAWQYAATESEHPAIVAASRRIASGATPSEALVEVAAREQATDAGAAAVAAAWCVAERAGAALAPALRGVSEALRDRAESARDIATALAGPRATARLMSWLPLVGLGMAYMIGVDVFGTLLAGPVGWIAAAAGAALVAIGRVWTARLTGSAGRTGSVAGLELVLVAIALSGGMSAAAARETTAEAGRRSGLGTVDHADASVARVLRIAEQAGAPATDLLLAEARQERRGARAEGRRRAELLAVRLLLPLGVCVLPAFALLGVVPVILAMISSTLVGLT